MDATFIYALADPVSKLVRYVGKADNPKDRLCHHISSARKSTRSHKSAWIRGLLAMGMRPELIILEKVQIDQWKEAEKKHILAQNTPANQLLNIAPGGDDGPTGYRHSPDAIRKIGDASKGNQYAKGHKHPESFKKARREFRHSEETRVKMSATRIGHQTSEETKQKIRMGNFISGSKRSKLTPDSVRSIRKEYSDGGITMDQLHKKYGISIERVHAIVHRTAWGHLE